MMKQPLVDLIFFGGCFWSGIFFLVAMVEEGFFFPPLHHGEGWGGNGFIGKHTAGINCV